MAAPAVVVVVVVVNVPLLISAAAEKATAVARIVPVARVRSSAATLGPWITTPDFRARTRLF